MNPEPSPASLPVSAGSESARIAGLTAVLTRPAPVPLWHFTCSHGVEGITKLRTLHPNKHLLLPGMPSLLWLTDLDYPDRDGLGLTSDRLSCDRTEYRVRVEQTEGAQWWPEWARAERVPRLIRDDLEAFGRPAHWWVCASPLPIASIEPTA